MKRLARIALSLAASGALLMGTAVPGAAETPPRPAMNEWRDHDANYHVIMADDATRRNMAFTTWAVDDIVPGDWAEFHVHVTNAGPAPASLQVWLHKPILAEPTDRAFYSELLLSGHVPIQVDTAPVAEIHEMLVATSVFEVRNKIANADGPFFLDNEVSRPVPHPNSVDSGLELVCIVVPSGGEQLITLEYDFPMGSSGGNHAFYDASHLVQLELELTMSGWTYGNECGAPGAPPAVVGHPAANVPGNPELSLTGADLSFLVAALGALSIGGLLLLKRRHKCL